MGNVRFTTVKNVPVWAENYLYYGDDSGITDDDRKMVEAWVGELAKKNIRLVCPDSDTYNEFNSDVAFGLKCATEDWSAEIARRTFKLKVRKTQECTIYVDAYSNAEAKRNAVKIAEGDGPSDGWWNDRISAVKCEEVLDDGD